MDIAKIIFFKYTSRSRVDNFFRGIDSIVNNIAKEEDFFILCSFDVDDSQYNNPVFTERLDRYSKIKYYFGSSSSKIDAINNDLDKLPKKWDILVNMSDDMIFTQWGFDDIIRDAMQQSFPDYDGWLHFHDGNQNRLATMSIMGKKYFSRSGYIYHSSYKSEWADNEEQEKAKIAGKYKYMGDSVKIIQHINPYHGHAGTMDDLYKINSVHYNSDKDNYFKRLAINFEL